ncbi:MAG: hypothetical protein LBQ60_18005 [Bacteroidales bacterium]|jgi:O-antigen/teichoic acid export membrane protein|nr:hypothetical protein [Bacteroidales bacterium]
MKKSISTSQRVVFNTGILYAKMLITAGVTLYSTRVILNALGASDYGIFNLIASAVVMLSFLNVAMSTATQRYLSYQQGTKNFSMQKKIFSNSWILHIIIGFIIIIILQIAALFLFNGFLNIPEERISAAKAVYHFMTATVFFTVLSVPFTASLNAHENMLWIAIVSIVEAVLRLVIALSLICFVQYERLIFFGLFMACISLISFLLYAFYCLKKYDECDIKIHHIDRTLMRELGSFAGWNLVGTFSGLGRNQGFAIVLNLFLGTIGNAAYGIAQQVSGQLNFFSATMLRALNPQIMKSEGANDRQRMLRLSMMASKFGFFLLAILAIPCIFEMSSVLELWLGNIPEYTVIFCSFMLISVMTDQLTIGLTSAIQATGKIKSYMIIVGSIKLLILPSAYVLLRLNYSIMTVLIVYVSLEILAGSFRLLSLKMIAGLSLKEYFNRVFKKEFLPVCLSISSCLLIIYLFQFNLRFLLTFSVSIIVFIVTAYFTGLCDDEKIIVEKLLLPIRKKISFFNR